MTILGLNLVLALLWAAVAGEVDVAHLVVGLVVEHGVLWLARPLLPSTTYFAKLPLAIRFTGFFLWEMLLANLRVAWDVLTPKAHRRPGVVAVPLTVTTDAEITLLANLVTLCHACHVEAERKVAVMSTLTGLSRVLGQLIPLYLMCDPGDIGVAVEARAPDSALPTVTVYEKAPAGILVQPPDRARRRWPRC